MQDLRLAHTAAAVGQLAVGEDRGEGIGADDRRSRSEVGLRLTVRGSTPGCHELRAGVDEARARGTSVR